MKAKSLAGMLLLCIACCPNKALFVQVVSDHRSVTVETVDSLLVSIESDLQERQGVMSETDVQSVNNLIDRLKFMKQGSIVMEKYVMNQADAETLANVIHNKLNN